ncbi:MAG: glutamine synthetase type III, partial [Akkermansia sp.]|nr:glutamine synthetase type III [Akkermansia sp.]
IDIEAKTCLNMLRTIYLPAIAAQMSEICGTVNAIQAAGITAGLKAATFKANEIGAYYDELMPEVDALAAAIEAGEPFAMRAAMEKARETVDALEAIVDAALWPVPTYAQMLNIHSK